MLLLSGDDIFLLEIQPFQQEAIHEIVTPIKHHVSSSNPIPPFVSRSRLDQMHSPGKTTSEIF